ncbi:MAG: hypothetical protein AAF493_11780 [Pseudomonadota bacterium]
METKLNDERSIIAQLRGEVEVAQSGLHESRQRLEQCYGRQASLEALQEGALGQHNEAVAQWIAHQGLDGTSRLAESIEVAPGWELAVEAVLGRLLEGLCVDDTDGWIGALDALDTGAVALIGAGTTDRNPAHTGARLADQVTRGPAAVVQLLQGVRTADNAEQARTMVPALGANESVITRDGLWLGAGWARLVRGDERELGVLEREQQRRDLEQEIEVVNDEVRAQQSALDSRREALHAAEERAGAIERERSEAQDTIARLRADEAARGAEREQRARRLEAVRREREDVDRRADAQRSALDEARQRLATALEQSQALEAEGAGWTERRGVLETELQSRRASWQSNRHDAYEARLRVESIRTQIEGLKVGQARLASRLTSHEQRCDELNESLHGIDRPLDEAEARLRGELENHRQLEGNLAGARSETEAAETMVRDADTKRVACERRVEQEREQLNELRMQAQESIVRRDTVSEQMAEGEYALEPILEGLEPDATEAVWSEQMAALERRISRLGPINLAAIDEFETESERKGYLDRQHDDLTEALATLESAIQKIDRETRARFKETYEKLNAGLQEKFPRLFGGGFAQLELTGDDLLSTGVTVTARPPGKRNASISQLSGGEKALTAVALVFAIFELNPSPFCLLDEVDAPLDDANVGRFSNLIQEMSEQVQVLFVTHNKGTMEVAQQLIGVTMNEPGVSRLVAVDVDEAMEMVAV